MGSHAQPPTATPTRGPPTSALHPRPPGAPACPAGPEGPCRSSGTGSRWKAARGEGAFWAAGARGGSWSPHVGTWRPWGPCLGALSLNFRLQTGGALHATACLRSKEAPALRGTPCLFSNVPFLPARVTGVLSGPAPGRRSTTEGSAHPLRVGLQSGAHFKFYTPFYFLLWKKI